MKMKDVPVLNINMMRGGTGEVAGVAKRHFILLRPFAQRLLAHGHRDRNLQK